MIVENDIKYSVALNNIQINSSLSMFNIYINTTRATLTGYTASILPVFLAKCSNVLKKKYPNIIESKPTSNC